MFLPTNIEDTREKGSGMVISEAFKSYGSDVIAFKNQSRKTEENSVVTMRSLVSYFGDVDICTLTFEDIRNWKQCLDKNKKPQTVRNYIIKLRVVLKYLRAKGIDCLDPDSLPVPKKVDTIPKYLSKEEVETLIKCCQTVKQKAIVSMLYSSGLRVGELINLNRDDIKDSCFTVVGKGGYARLCFIDKRTDRLIKQYLYTRKDNLPALFLSETGIRIRVSSIQEFFQRLSKWSGISVHPHTLRHSFATNLLESNTNLYYVQRLMGHRSLQTTQQYLHSKDADLQRIYAKHHTT